MFGFGKKKKEKEDKLESELKALLPVKPKNTTRRAIMELVLVNNNTDKEYRYKSENDFGLTWDAVGDEQWLIINQSLNVEQTRHFGKARCMGFSITDIVWQTFNIEEELVVNNDVNADEPKKNN